MLKIISKLNLWISLGAGVLTLGFTHRIGLIHEYFYAALAFLGTLAVYNFQRIIKSQKLSDAQPHLLWYKRHSSIAWFTAIFSGLAAGLLLLYILNWNIHTIATLCGLGLIAVLYVVKIFKIPLREVPFLKIHMVALVWIGLCLYFPVINENSKHSSLTDVIFWAHYLYFVAITIPFDYRDVMIDAPSFKTIPQFFGKNLALGLSLLCFSVYSFIIIQYTELYHSSLIYGIIVYHLICIIVFFRNFSPYISAFLLDGGIIMVGIYYYFAV